MAIVSYRNCFIYCSSALNRLSQVNKIEPYLLFSGITYLKLAIVLSQTIFYLFNFFPQHAQAPEALGIQCLALWQEEGLAGSK